MIISYLHPTWVEGRSDLFAVVSIPCSNVIVLTRPKLTSRKLLQKQFIVNQIISVIARRVWVLVLIIPDDREMLYSNVLLQKCKLHNQMNICFILREIQPTRSEKYMFRIWPIEFSESGLSDLFVVVSMHRPAHQTTINMQKAAEVNHSNHILIKTCQNRITSV